MAARRGGPGAPGLALAHLLDPVAAAVPQKMGAGLAGRYLTLAEQALDSSRSDLNAYRRLKRALRASVSARKRSDTMTG